MRIKSQWMTVAGAVALACTHAAHADFLGWSCDTAFPGSNGFWGMNVYAQFSDPGDRLFACGNAHITTSFEGGFFQSQSNPFWAPSGTQNQNTSLDSWVTIGTNPNGNGNAFGGTAGGPDFANFADYSGTTTYDYSVIESGPSGASWYNPNSANSYGYATGGRVLVGHFVFYIPGTEEPIAPHGAIYWNVTADVTLASGGQTYVGAGDHVFFWIPGPGPLAVLAVAGLGQRRARKR